MCSFKSIKGQFRFITPQILFLNLIYIKIRRKIFLYSSILKTFPVFRNFKMMKKYIIRIQIIIQ